MWSQNSKENIELISVTMVTSLEAVLGESHELDGGDTVTGLSPQKQETRHLREDCLRVRTVRVQRKS